jgi:hypothetical protein
MAVDHLEQSGAERRMEAGVVAVLHPCEPLEGPTTGEAMKVHCDDLVDHH